MFCQGFFSWRVTAYFYQKGPTVNARFWSFSGHADCRPTGMRRFSRPFLILQSPRPGLHPHVETRSASCVDPPLSFHTSKTKN